MAASVLVFAALGGGCGGRAAALHAGSPRLPLQAIADIALSSVRWAVPSWRPAHTVAVDPETHEVFFPLPHVDGHGLVRVMRPT